MRKPDIHLEKVTDDNVDAIVKLRVTKEQRKFVASNNWSLIDAYLSLAEGKPVFPFGIYNGKGAALLRYCYAYFQPAGRQLRI